MKLSELLSKTIVAGPWEKIGVFPHHGINLPLSALHTKNSCGIGEFFDLIPMIDWCSNLKLDVLQLLSLNDSGDDPSPYFCISSCALNSLFLSLHALPDVQRHPSLQKKMEKMHLLNQSPRVQYEEVQKHKLVFLREYFDLEGQSLLKTKKFEKFSSENSWVKPYALFKALKHRVSKNHWTAWPKDLINPDKAEYTKLLKEHASDVLFYTLLQYLSFSQLEDVKKYADRKKVHLFGDIPILLSSDSADVWHHPEFFDLHQQAGSAPDMFNEKGQAWGFPIMRWEAMKNSHYSFWKERLAVASRFYHIYRIDHVIGLFRIWAIPMGHPSKDGTYIPHDINEWIPHGETILKMMAKHSPMLPIAEDLGVVLPIMRETLTKMGICGIKVIRWERNWDGDKSFIPFEEYNPISLTTVSTHDSETLSLWWRDLPEEAKAFAHFKNWKYTPELSIAHRREILWDSHHTNSLFHVKLLQEYLALFPELVSPVHENERINVPGSILPSNWTYRFRPSVEELLQHENLRLEMVKITT